MIRKGRRGAQSIEKSIEMEIAREKLGRERRDSAADSIDDYSKRNAVKGFTRGGKGAGGYF